MVAEPAALPLTTPAVLTLATDGAEELHVPPEVVSENVVVAATQTEEAPVIEATIGAPVTVIVCMVLLLHPGFVPVIV